MTPKVITKHLFWEDFSVGSIWTHGPYLVTEDEIIEFAERYDPLEFHTSPEQARNTPLGIFCASGVHTFGIAQRLLCEAVFLQSHIVAGSAVDEFRMRLPVIPGDSLCLKATVASAWRHHTRKDRGWTELCIDIMRLQGDIVLDYKLTILLQSRPTDQEF